MLFGWRTLTVAWLQFWTLLLPSFSHQGWDHLTGNMVMLLYLGPRIHEMLGRAHFLGLYVAAAAAGSLATDIACRLGYLGTASDALRYYNILQGNPALEQASLGASDAVIGMLGFWYMAFPRSKVHLFRGYALVERLLAPKPGTSAGTLRKAALGLLSWPLKLRFSALWLLPAYFLADTAFLLRKAAANRRGEPEQVESHTNHAAHVGGFGAGVAYYFWKGMPIKARLAPHLLLLRDPRRLYLMSLSLAVWGVAFAATASQQSRLSTVSVIQNKRTEDSRAEAHDSAEQLAREKLASESAQQHLQPLPVPRTNITLPPVVMMGVSRKELPALWQGALGDGSSQESTSNTMATEADEASAAAAVLPFVPQYVALLERACQCANVASLRRAALAYASGVAARDGVEVPAELTAKHEACDPLFMAVRKAIDDTLAGHDAEHSDLRHRTTMQLCGGLVTQPMKRADVIEALTKSGVIAETDTVEG